MSTRFLGEVETAPVTEVGGTMSMGAKGSQGRGQWGSRAVRDKVNGGQGQSGTRSMGAKGSQGRGQWGPGAVRSIGQGLTTSDLSQSFAVPCGRLRDAHTRSHMAMLSRATIDPPTAAADIDRGRWWQKVGMGLARGWPGVAWSVAVCRVEAEGIM
jgi:hypothetical protein